MIPTRRVRLAVIGISLALFILALCLPSAVFLQNPGRAYAYSFHRSGIILFFMAFFGPFSGNFAGFANPLALAGLLMISAQKYRGAAITLFIAFLLTFQIQQLHGQKVLEDEGGVNISYMTHLLVGWYVWALSIFFPFAAAVYFKWFAPKLQDPVAAPRATPGPG